VVAGWDAAADQREVHLHLSDVHAGTGAPATADVGSVMKADGSGTLVFDVLANLVGSAESLETGRVRARWTPEGAGRADVEAHGGDAGEGFLVTECWNARFERVYALERVADGGRRMPSKVPPRLRAAELATVNGLAD